MYAKAMPIYYGLATIVVSATLFLAVPFSKPEVATVQSELMQRLSIGWQQTMGDRSWFVELDFIFDVTNDFYTMSADATISFLDDPEADADIYYVLNGVYEKFGEVFNGPTEKTVAKEALPLPTVIGDNFMKEAPLYNLVPYREVVKTISTPAVAGTAVSASGPWNTITDALTGQKYCLAIYNGEVNQYLGTCESQGYY